MKEKIALAYRLLIVIVTAIALYLNFKFLTFRMGILYFTNISNLLCFVYFLLLIIATITNRLKKDENYYLSKGMVTMGITITMLIFNFILSSDLGVFENHMLECNLVHIVVPIMVILDYILFDEKGHLKKEYPIKWSLILVLYQVFVLIYKMLGGKFLNGADYPYFYMDIEKYGFIKVLLYLLLTYVFFVGLGSLIQIIDNKIKKK